MPSQRKNVLIISYSPLHRDPRVLRQIQALKDEYSLETVGFSSSGISTIRHSNLQSDSSHTFFQKIIYVLKVIFHQYERILLERFGSSEIINSPHPKPAVIIANDWDGLYLAAKLKEKNNWNAKVYFDAHEYEPKHFKSIVWKLFIRPQACYVLNTYKNCISVMTTVCKGIALEYEKFLDFPENSIEVITNAPVYETGLKPSPVSGKIKLIHHGVSSKERRLDLMIEMMKYLDSARFELYLMLVHDEHDIYYEYLERLAAPHKNIRFVPTVPTDMIAKEINKYDIGFFLIPPTNFNYKHCLPNKFFEFIQARLCVAIGPSTEMIPYIKKYGFGVHSDDFSPKSLAMMLTNLSDNDIIHFKAKADEACEKLCAENNMDKIKSAIDRLSHF